MIACIEHEARMLRVGTDGAEHRAHLEAAAERGNEVARAALLGPEFPETLDYLYGWWQELAAGRSEGFNGPAPIGYRDIEAWSRLTGIEPSAEETRALLVMDAAFRRALRDDAPKATDLDAAPVTPAWPKKKG